MSELTDELAEVYDAVSRLPGVEPELLSSFRLCVLKVATLENENTMNKRMVERLGSANEELFEQGVGMAKEALNGRANLIEDQIKSLKEM